MSNAANTNWKRLTHSSIMYSSLSIGYALTATGFAGAVWIYALASLVYAILAMRSCQNRNI